MRESDLEGLTPGLAGEFGLEPLVARLLVRRGLSVSERIASFLDPGRYRPTSPEELPGVEGAVERLLEARERKRPVCVWGDFDVDGQTATALLVEGLSRLGMQVFYYLPSRQDGHGLNLDGMRQIRSRGADLILTCDCGVGSAEEVRAAREMGLEVVITDHHELPESTPPATALVNPRLLPEGHPLELLCGVGVAHCLLEALRSASGSQPTEEGLDLVALGTIADLVELRGENRFLVQRGLPALLYRSRPGIEALLRTAGAAIPELPDPDIVSFTLAPRLNAAGRLGDPRTGVELLLAGEEGRGLQLAAELEILNDQRRRLCEQMEHQAEEMLEAKPDLVSLPALVLAHPDWNPGIIGPVAGRLVERHGKPVVLICASEGRPARASARSVPGLHILRAITGCKELLLDWGGHAAAAGFSISRAAIDRFSREFQERVGGLLPTGGGEEVEAEEWIGLEQLTDDLVRQLYRLGPFGPGNEKPLLGCRGVHLRNPAKVGLAGLHSRLLVEKGGERIKGVWWRMSPEKVPKEEADIAFRVHLENYRGRTEVGLELVEVSERKIGPEPGLPELGGVPFAVEDWRGKGNRREALERLRKRGNIQIWGEGSVGREVAEARGRHQLVEGRELVIWTIPPGPQLLREVLRQVKPERVHLMTGEASMENPTDFLRLLGSAVKGVIAKNKGETSLAELAALTAQRESAVRLGLDFLAGRGRLCFREEEGRLFIEAKEGPRRVPGNGEDLKSLLRETAAYRRYFARGEPERVLQVEGD
jgi:single-stranded-DNA-specific exonuclease